MSSLNYFFTTLPWKRLTTAKLKFLVMSSPIILLATTLTLFNVVQTSYAHILEQRILPAIEDRERIFSMKKQNSMDAKDFVPYYTEEDLGIMRGISTVADVSEIKPSLLTPAATDSLIEGESIILQDFRGVSNKAVELLGINNFTFTEDQPIPVVIGIEALKQYKEILKVSDNTPAEQKAEMLTDFQRTSSLVSTYPHRDKITQISNKRFTFTLGMLDQAPILNRSIQLGKAPYTFFSDASRQAMQSQSKRLIERYWDYNKLAKGIEVKAKVVGIDYSLNKSVISLPYEAVEFLHQRLLDHQKSALLPGKAIDYTEIGNIFQGIGITDEGAQSGHKGADELIASETMAEMLPSTFIPGLYYSSNRDGSNTLLATALSIDALKASEVAIAMTDVSQQNNTINALVGNGLIGQFEASSTYMSIKSFDQLLDTASFFISTIFTSICVIIALFLMLRTAKNSQFEIGVLRLIGATKNQILLHTTGLLSWQLLSSLLFGILVAYIAVLALSPHIAHYLQHSPYLSLGTIQSNFGIEVALSSADVRRLSISTLLTNLGWVVAVSWTGVLLAALLNARISPIEIVNKNR